MTGNEKAVTGNESNDGERGSPGIPQVEQLLDTPTWVVVTADHGELGQTISFNSSR